jgi:hypothetical protein
MSIANLLFPEGNFLNIRANAPNQRSYNIDATRDLVENNPFGLAGEIYAPATSFFTSPFYDAIQAAQRMQPGSGIKGFAKAFDAENPISSAFERAYGATLPLADRLSNIFSRGQAIAAEPNKINTVSNTPGFQIVTNPDGTIQVVPVGTTNQFPFKSMEELAAANAISNPFQRTDLIGLFDEGLTGKKDDEEENLTGLFDEGLTTGMPSFGSTQKAPTAFGTKRRGGGISDLFRALIGFAVPGSSFFTGGLDGIRSLNQRLQGSTFGRSRSMQEFLERKRNEKLGNVGPRGIGLSRSELVQKNFANRVRDLADAGDDDRGGGASRTQRDAGPGFSGSGTAAEMGSF